MSGARDPVGVPASASREGSPLGCSAFVHLVLSTPLFCLPQSAYVHGVFLTSRFGLLRTRLDLALGDAWGIVCAIWEQSLQAE